MKGACTQIFVFLLPLLLAVLSACSHKEIMCPDTEPKLINVSFEWDNAPRAEPEGMTLLFFSADSRGRTWRFDVGGRSGGAVELPPGEYRMIAHNNDLPGILFSNADSFSTYSASLRRQSAGDGYMPGGMLYGATVGWVEVTPCGVSYRTSQGAVKECPKNLIRCYPDSITTMFTVRFRNVSGIERLKAATASLSGVAPAITLADREPLDSPVSIDFSLSADAARSELTATAGAFLPVGADNRYMLTLAIKLAGGKTMTRDFDVTERVLNSPSRFNVEIVIDGIVIPDGDTPTPPGESFDGISVGVDGWSTVEIDLTTDVNT